VVVNMLAFLQTIRALKALPRSGWLSHGVTVRDVESIADHSFSVSAISLLLADLELKRGVQVDVEKVLRMATLHDLAESLTFDISKAYLQYLGKRGEEIKHEIEHSAWSALVKELDDSELATKYTRAESEYDANETVESKIVHAADGLDILLQIIAYQQRGYARSSLEELWKGTETSLKRSQIQSTRKLLKALVQANSRRTIR
jgi:putative hydrolase of HD superfamily